MAVELLEIDRLKNAKNLLAFSGGVDSSCLFFMLLEQKIDFDIAIVNYNIREQSKLEVEYARYLAKKYDKLCFVKEVYLSKENFEHNARSARYSFFSEIMTDYENLILAHQLNDKIEWLMMQLCKGASLQTLLGFDSYSLYKSYSIIRPLALTPRVLIEKYLNEKNIKHFTDESNIDEKYKRNMFRKSIENIVNKNHTGIIKSLFYLEKEKRQIYKEISILRNKKLSIFVSGDEGFMNIADKIFKENGYLLSANQRLEIEKNLMQGKNIAIADIWVVAKDGNKYFICPYLKALIPRNIREKYRIAKVPKLCRGYFYTENIELSSILSQNIESTEV